MIELFNLGISEEEIKNMLETNPDLEFTTEQEIQNLISILKQTDCSDKSIKNILISNPFYLTRIDVDVLKLIKKLTSIGFRNLNLLFDTNPYLLNKDAFEIDDFLNKNLKDKTLEEIIDIIDHNPYIMDEE